MHHDICTILTSFFSSITFLLSTTNRRSRKKQILSACSVRERPGDGRKRGTCGEEELCRGDGTCIPRCNVKGKPGDGVSRGTCDEHQICTKNGYCLNATSNAMNNNDIIQLS